MSGMIKKRPGRRPRDHPSKRREPRPGAPLTVHGLASGVVVVDGIRVRLPRPAEIDDLHTSAVTAPHMIDGDLDLAEAARVGILSSALLQGLTDRDALTQVVSTFVAQQRIRDAFLSTSLVLVAEVDGQPAGVSRAGPSLGFVTGVVNSRPSTEMVDHLIRGLRGAAEIDSVSVAPRWRGHGVGRALVEVATQVFRGNGYVRMYGRVATDRALTPFWQACGFTVLPAGEGISMWDVFGVKAALTPSPTELLCTVELEIPNRRTGVTGERGKPWELRGHQLIIRCL